MDEISFILKVHCNFSIVEMNELLWDEVENYYKKWYDYEMNNRITQLAINGIEYKNPEKSKTTFYKDYIEESERTRKELTLKEEYMEKLNIKEVVKRPKFLFERKEVKSG